ncbi:MAG: hypothetical protein AB7S26_11930 [Sandaracinaceae bacterium]
MTATDRLAECLVLGALLEQVREVYGEYELVAHWTQGEFHHDVVLRVRDPKDLPGPVLVVATNCNGGVKEVLSLGALPDRSALWHARCPDNSDFEGPTPEVLASARTTHWFDPCELLRDDARSELKPEFRKRQRGGGWEPTFE